VERAAGAEEEEPSLHRLRAVRHQSSIARFGQPATALEFQGANAKRLDVIKMCADCRVEAVVNESFDPHAAPQRPPVMTTEDYLRARNVKKDDPLGS
jgi:hypothetical protein